MTRSDLDLDAPKPGGSVPGPAPRKTTLPRVRHVGIVGVGSYLPPTILTNGDLERLVETSDTWIASRTGIRERRIASSEQATSDLACHAARPALAAAGVFPEEIDLIVVATVTPDMPFPSTACLVQAKLGATKAAAFDIEAACSGFVYALEIAARFIASHSCETALVIGAEKMSSVVDWTDRNTCVLFGDGAGAAVLRPRPDGGGLLATCLGSDGGKASMLELPGGGSRRPTTAETVAQRLHYLRMDGRETFKSAVNAMVAAAQEALRKCAVAIEDLRCIIPHQANHRIIDAVAERLGARPDQMFVNVARCGNTSAASVGIALEEASRTRRINRGDLVLLVVVGAGLTWGAAVIEW